MLFMLKVSRADCYPMRQECLAASLGLGGNQRESSNSSRTPDQDSSEEHQHSTYNHLERSGKEGSIHVAMTHEADGRELSGHDRTSHASGEPEIRNKKGQGVSQPSGGSH